MTNPNDILANLSRNSAGATDESPLLHFVCTETDIVSEESEAMHTYGMEIHIIFANRSASEPHLALCYPDITTKGEQLRHLVNLMNRLDLSPNHVGYVLEDFMVDCSIE